MSIKVDPRRLWCDLKAKLAKKPPETCSAATQDEYFVEIQNGFLQLITFFPLYAVENMVELEMWNVLYKTQINSLQSLLHRRLPFSGNSGSFKYSTMELKLRLVLLLDRASGVYFNLIYQLLQPISEQTWPKVILGILANFDAVLDLDNNRVEHVSDFLDLDLATFSANRAFSRKIKYPELKSSLTTYESETSVITPRILSRGDRLPSEIETITSNVENCKISDQIGKSVDKLVVEDEKESSKVNINQNSDFHYLDQEAAVIYLVHHCLVHLGDIARYRQQPNVAAGYYLWAWVVHPDSGHSFNQLAILEATKPLPRRCIDALFYYYIRALSCLHSFPAAMNNLSNVLADYYKSSELSTCDDNNVEINTGLAKDVVSSSKRWPQFNNIQMKSLIQFYAALQLHTDPRKLMLIADDLFETMDNWGTIELSKIQLLRILCIHFCLTDQYLSDAKSNLSSFQTIDKQPSILHNKYQTGTILLLCLTIRLINWMASSSVIASSPNEHVSNGSNVKPVITHVSNDNYNHDDDNINNDPANKNENSFLISSPTTNVYPTPIGNKMNEVAYQSESIFALNLLFLWFRSNRFYEIINAETKLSYELTDSLFKLLTPAFTENTVCILNNLLKHYRPLLHNLNSSENKQPTDIPVAVSHNSDDKNGNVHSKTIDDIIVKEEKSENPSFLNNHIDDAFHKNNDHGNESINIGVTPIDWVRLMKLPETVILQGFQPLHIPTQRSLCSSSSVAYNPVNPFLLDFYHDKLNELIISKCPSQHQNNASQPQFEIETERILCLLTSARYIAEVFPSLVNWIPNSNGVENFDSTETLMWSGSFYCNSHSSYSLKDMFSLLSISTNITSSSNKETQSVNLEESISPKSNPAYPNVMSNNDHQLNCEHKTVTQLTRQKSEIAVTIENHETIKPNNLMNDETEKLLSSSQVTSTSSDSVAIPSTVSSSSLPSSLLPHVGTSGGLIMNAELAKFIQEQASQVAARQQRFNISSNPINNDSQQQLTPVGAPMPSNICGSLSSGEGETSLSSRLSATFKRNLPPRYAKLLQAELQENEALKNRHNHHQIQKEVNSPLLSLDQPAPLARKESEAPIDLISLLSSSDVNTVALHHELQQRNMHQPQWF
ncbi:Protein SMG7 [Schistosoma japonicum]|nr:Protein SMG7 [Schistosoma japonicum]